MHFSWGLIGLAYIHLAAKMIVVTLLAARSKVTRWASLFTFCYLGTIADIFLFHALALYRADRSVAHYTTYYYAYYSWRIIASILLVWILVDVLRSFPGADFIGVRLPVMALSFCASLACGTGYIAFHLKPFTHFEVAAIAIQMETAVDVAWGVFLAGALCCIFLSKLGWSREGALIANGLILAVFGKMLYGLCTSFLPLARIDDYVSNTFNIFGCVVWISAALCREEVFQLPAGLASLSDRLCQLPSEKVG